jgi:hypothetical protein
MHQEVAEKGKGKAVSVTDPLGYETSGFPRLLDNCLTNGAPAALYPPGRFLVLISVRG